MPSIILQAGPLAEVEGPPGVACGLHGRLQPVSLQQAAVT